MIPVSRPKLPDKDIALGRNELRDDYQDRGLTGSLNAFPRKSVRTVLIYEVVYSQPGSLIHPCFRYFSHYDDSCVATGSQSFFLLLFFDAAGRRAARSRRVYLSIVVAPSCMEARNLNPFCPQS